MHASIVSVAALAVLFASATRASVAFEEILIDAGFLIEHPPISLAQAPSGNHYVVLVGRDSDYRQRLAVYRLDASDTIGKPAVALNPGMELGAFDAGRLASGDALLLIAPGRIVRLDFDSGGLVEVLRMDSLYRQQQGDGLLPLDFFRDLNGDGLDDLLVPDLAGYRVRLQLDSGMFGAESQLLGSIAMSASEDGVYLEPRPLFVGDVNFDGRTDLVTWRADALQVYHQQADLRFDSEPRLLPLPLNLPSEAQMRALERDMGAVDQSQLTEKRISAVTDFNSDGLPDILTEATLSEGVFDKRNELRVHLGRRSEGTVAYSGTEDALLDSEGLQFGLKEIDLNGDGRMDLIVRKVRMNFGRVIGALLSGSVPLQVQFFLMSDQQQYPERANHVTRSKVKFSIKSGQVDIPAIQVADFDGDGLQDLVIESDRGTLALYLGNDQQSLFAEDRTETAVTLPRNGELVRAQDLDGDGKSDLVIRYTVADGDNAANTVRLLLARDRQRQGSQ